MKRLILSSALFMCFTVKAQNGLSPYSDSPTTIDSYKGNYKPTFIKDSRICQLYILGDSDKSVSKSDVDFILNESRRVFEANNLYFPSFNYQDVIEKVKSNGSFFFSQESKTHVYTITVNDDISLMQIEIK